jgi:hypothetical protein
VCWKERGKGRDQFGKSQLRNITEWSRKELTFNSKVNDPNSLKEERASPIVIW